MAQTKGTRRPDGTPVNQLQVGEYALCAPKANNWLGVAPSGDVANLLRHEVRVNDDGTITVAPSIHVTGKSDWHGHLTDGVWIEIKFEG